MWVVVTFDNLFKPDRSLRSEAAACVKHLQNNGQEAEVLNLPFNSKGDVLQQVFAISLIDWEHHTGVVFLQDIAGGLDSKRLYRAVRDRRGRFVLKNDEGMRPEEIKA